MKTFRHQTTTLVCAPAFIVGTAGSPPAAGTAPDHAAARKTIAREILKELGVLPASAT